MILALFVILARSLVTSVLHPKEVPVVATVTFAVPKAMCMKHSGEKTIARLRVNPDKCSVEMAL